MKIDISPHALILCDVLSRLTTTPLMMKILGIPNGQDMVGRMYRLIEAQVNVIAMMHYFEDSPEHMAGAKARLTKAYLENWYRADQAEEAWNYLTSKEAQ